MVFIGFAVVGLTQGLLLVGLLIGAGVGLLLAAAGLRQRVWWGDGWLASGYGWPVAKWVDLTGLQTARWRLSYREDGSQSFWLVLEDRAGRRIGLAMEMLDLDPALRPMICAALGAALPDLPPTRRENRRRRHRRS